MKTKLLFSAIVLVFIGSAIVSCTKEELHIQPQHKSPSPPVAEAGDAQDIDVPATDCVLGGSAFDVDGDIEYVSWAKISGPGSPEITSPDALFTQVRNLQPGGNYLFELTVTDRTGLRGKDTCKVNVKKASIGSNQIILENRVWIFPWYNALEVERFNILIPLGVAFNISIKRDNSPVWIAVSPFNQQSGAEYEYFIETRPFGAGMYNYGSLYIFYYGQDVGDTPDVRVQF